MGSKDILMFTCQHFLGKLVVGGLAFTGQPVLIGLHGSEASSTCTSTAWLVRFQQRDTSSKKQA